VRTVRLILRFSVYIGIFLYELVKANFQVARAVLSPGLRFRSAALRYKSRTRTIPELMVLTNSITLTPGTLVMDADMESGEILIHVMSAESADKVRDDIYESLEKRMLWAMRGEKE